MIYTVTLNPALDKTVEIPSMTLNRVNRITNLRTDPGGKGINVSKVIQKLGGTSIACGILGGTTGERILASLKEMGLETCFAWEKGETRTNVKIIDPVCHTNTDINEPGLTVAVETLDGLRENLAERIGEGDIAVLSGSLQNGAPEDTYGVWAARFAKKGALVFLDADGKPLRNALAAAPFLIKPNHYELSELMGRELTSVPELKAAARELIEQYGICRVVVSMGAEGALYVSRTECIYAKGMRVPVGSTVGAGDSVVAALAYAMEKGLGFAEAVRLSAAAGAANVMCSGSQAAEYAVIEELLARVELLCV